MKKLLVISIASFLFFSCSDSNDIEPLPEGPSAEHPVVPEPAPEHPTVADPAPTPNN
ncbi:hypothetical protein [Flammeovirga pacifica]|uniref:hypothetical protein n=1 Tax=Flammeovirga pacifica TaxID=915059 RepID=UPI00130145EC|nr:hypothetical protein [Flammeovirga pacifica]